MKDARLLSKCSLTHLFIGLAFILCSLAACPPSSHATDPLSRLQPALDLVVMINGERRGVEKFGAGILVARRQGRLLIATANHLVRGGGQEMHDIKVRLHALPEERLQATLLDTHSPELDLALLEVQLPSALAEQIRFDFHVLAEQDADLTSLDVYPVGQVDSYPWNTPSLGAKGFQPDDNMLRFESNFIGPGSSGGGLIGDSGILLGMVLNKEPPHGEARDIHIIIDVIRNLGQPIDLVLAYGYSIAGEWYINDDNLFQKVVLERFGERVAGTISSRDTWVISYQQFFDTNSSVFEQTFFNGLEADIEGSLLGNRLDVRATGRWFKDFIRTVNSRIDPQQWTEIPFEAHLQGIVGADVINLDYTLNPAPVGNLTGDLTHGRVTAKRKIGPKVQSWQSILQEALEQNKE